MVQFQTSRPQTSHPSARQGATRAQQQAGYHPTADRHSRSRTYTYFFQEAKSQAYLTFHFQVTDPNIFAIKDVGGHITGGLQVSSGR